MKKIIKKPTYEMRCPYCACHFSFEKEDVSKYTNSRFDKVLCPHCESSIKITDESDKLLPNVKVRFEK